MVTRARYISIGFFLAAACSSAPAQEKVVNIDQQAAEIDKIVVTARKRQENAQTVPIAITAFSGAALEQSGVERIEDALQLVPNASITGGLGTSLQGEVGIRGISTLVRVIGVESGLGFYVDGIYTGRPETYSTDLVDVERVEVLRGPQGTLFGRNTIAGAINIVTNKSGADREATLGMELGNYNLFRLKGALSGPIKDGVLYGGFSASVAKRDGVYRDLSGGRALDDIDSGNYRAKLRATPSDKLELILAADGMRDRSHPNFTQVLEFAPGPVPTSTAPYTTNRNRENKLDKDIWGLSLTANYAAQPGTLTSITSVRGSKYTAFLDEDGNHIDWFNSLWTDKVHIFTQELRLAGTLRSKLDYVVGAYYFQQHATSYRPFSTGADFPYGLANFPITQAADVQSSSIAAFGHVTYRLDESWALAGGLRYTREKKDVSYDQTGAPLVVNVSTIDKLSNNAITPSFSVSYKASDQAMTYGSVSRGFKSGSFNTDFVPDAKSIKVDPEFATSYELGYKSELLNRRMRLNLAVFHTDYENLQVSQIDPAVVGVRLTNAGHAKINGAEIEVVARPVNSVDLGASLGYTDAKYDSYKNCAADPANPGRLLDCSGKRIKSVPQWTAALSAQYSHPIQDIGRLIVRGEWTYHSDQYFNTLNSVRLLGGSASLLNARIGISRSDWEVFLWGKNLGNKRYAAFMDDRGAIGIPLTVAWNEPRTAGISATCHW